MKFLATFVTLAALILTGGTALADDVVVAKNSKTITHACKDGKSKVTIAGNKNTVTLTGACKSVDVGGNKNTVIIAATGELNVMGNKNSITYSKGLGEAGQPKISNLGNKNVITKATKK